MSQEASSIFAFTNDHYKRVLYYELAAAAADGDVANDDEALVKYLKSNDLIASFYMINAKRNLIIVLKDRSSIPQVQTFLSEYKEIQCKQNVMPLSDFTSILVAEITDHQLKRLSKDKSAALKLIESQTGLKFKKQKKTFYFTGLLYQFKLLDELYSKYPPIEEEEEVEAKVDAPKEQQEMAAAPAAENKKQKFEYDCNTLVYYRQIHDSNFDQLKAAFKLTDAFVTTVADHEKLVFNYTSAVTGNEVLINELNKVKDKLQTMKLDVNLKSKQIVNQINQLFANELLAKTFKLLMLNYHPRQQNENVQLLGFKSDLDVFYEKNNENLRIKGDGTWSIGYSDEKTSTPVSKPVKQQHQQQQEEFQDLLSPSNSKNSKHGNILVTISSDNDQQRQVKSPAVQKEPLVKASLTDNRICLMCQKENVDNCILKCSNQTCTTGFCQKCLEKRVNKSSKTCKCPNCSGNFHLPSAPSTKQLSYGNSDENGFKYGHIDYELINAPCAGFERQAQQSYQLTYTCDKGIIRGEMMRHYAGTTKYWFIPALEGAEELAKLFIRALRNGFLFRLEYDERRQCHAILINSAIVLKTQLNGGGRFSYPDANYIRDITRTLKDLLGE